MMDTSANSMSSKKRPKLGRPKGSSKDKTLKRLFIEARKLFAAKGFAQTTFKDIGKALGVSHAAIYSYFPDKKSLYVETVNQTQAFLLPHYRAAYDQHQGLMQRLSAIFMAMAKAQDEDESITGLLASVPIEMRRHSELCDAFFEQEDQVMITLRKMVEEAKSSGEIDESYPTESVLTALFGAGVGVALFHYGTYQENLTEKMEILIKILCPK